MRILHLISSTGFYGAENVILNLARGLREDGHIPYILCLKGVSKTDPEIYFQALKEGLLSKVIPCRHRFDIKVIGEIKKFVSVENIDIIHSHGYKGNFYGLMASKFSRVPIITTIHLWTGETRKLRFYEYLDKRWLVKSMNHVVLVSPTFYSDVKNSNLGTEHITFIPNGIDTETFNPSRVSGSVRKEFGIEKALIIGNVARFHQEKGHVQLINIFNRIQSQIPEARLLLVGDGPLRNNLKSLVRRLDLQDKVIFAGVRSDLPALYKAMDIFVMPSQKEGMPMALLEAMAMALPVVATAVGGIPYVISKDGDGVLVEPQDADALFDAITSLIKDSSYRRRLGNRARAKIVSQFSLQILYKKYLEVYEKILCHSMVEVS